MLYAGDNDVAAGKTSGAVAADFDTFARNLYATLPSTRILFLAIKPSIARWSLMEEMREANRLIRNRTETDSRLTYVDVHTPMIGADGLPRPISWRTTACTCRRPDTPSGRASCVPICRGESRMNRSAAVLSRASAADIGAPRGLYRGSQCLHHASDRARRVALRGDDSDPVDIVEVRWIVGDQR